jgi:uncharacterized protein
MFSAAQIERQEEKPMSRIAIPWKLTATTAFALAVSLAIVFAVMRVVGTLGPINLRPLLPLGFVLMAITPWLLLNRGGRLEIGLKRPNHSMLNVEAIVLGAAAAVACFLIGVVLFGTSADNWFVSIAKSFA